MQCRQMFVGVDESNHIPPRNVIGRLSLEKLELAIVIIISGPGFTRIHISLSHIDRQNTAPARLPTLFLSAAVLARPVLTVLS